MAMESAFTQQPSALANPVPNATAQPDNLFDQALASAPSGQPIPAQVAREAEQNIGQVEPMGNPFDQALGAGEVPMEDPNQPDMSQDGFLQSNLTPSGLAQQFSNAEARIKASFGRTPKEQEGILKGVLGDKNVQKRGDTFFIKPKGKNKFVRLESDSFEIFGDLALDSFRDIMSGMFGTAAVAAKGPTAVEPITTAAAFAGGVAIGETIADTLVESAFGVPRDPSRGGTVGADAGVGEKIGAGLERTGGSLMTGATAAMFNAAGNKIAQSVSARREAMKGLKTLKDTPVGETLKANVDQVIQTMDDLGAMNKTVNLPGSNMPVLAHQLAPHTDATQVAKSLAKNPSFQKAQNIAVKNMDDTVVGMLEEAGELAPKSLRTVLTKGETVPRGGLQQDVTRLFKDVRQAEGKIIDQFRMKAGSEAGKMPVDTPRTMEALDNIFDQLNIKLTPSGTLKFPNNDDLAQILGTDSGAVINGIKKDFNMLFRRLKRNAMQTAKDGGDAVGFTLDDIIAQSKIMGGKYEGAAKFGGKYKAFMGKLASSLRADTREAMPDFLSPEDAQAYVGSIAKFQKAAEGQAALKNILKQSDMATNTFVKGVINKGKGGLAQFKAAKEFLVDEDPALWDKMRAEFFEELVLKHRKTDAQSLTTFNMGALRKELAGYGPEMLQELMPNKSVKPGQVFRALDLSEQVERTLIKGTDDEVEKIAKSLFQASSSFLSAKLNSAYALFKFGTADNRMLKLMNRKGVDAFLEKVPASERGVLKQVLESHIAMATKKGIIKTIQTSRDVVRPGIEVGLGESFAPSIPTNRTPQ